MATAARGLGRDGRAPAADLSAVAGDLLHVLDVLRLGRARLAHRLRLPHHLYRPGADDRPVLAADRAHRAAGQGAEHHLDRRLHRRALRQEPGGRRHRGADRHHRHHSLHRAAAQSGVVLARAPSSPTSRRRPASTQPVLGDIALFVALSMATFAVLFGTRHIDATEHQDGLMLAIATELIVKLVAFLAVGIFVTFCDVRRTGARCSQAHATQPDDRGRASPASRASTRSSAMTLLSFVAIILLPRQFHVTVVENNNEARDQARRLAVSALSGADQPVRGADRARRPAHLPAPARSTATCSCWRCRCSAARTAHHRRLRRRAVGGDRHGDRRIGRARRSWCRTTSSCRWCCSGARRCISGARQRRRAAADRAAAGDLRHPAARLPVLPLGRRRPARLDRPALVRRDRAARAGVFRRPDLAARHRARRHRRHDRRHPGLGLYAAAAELRRRRHRRPAHPHRRPLGHRRAAAAASVRPRSAAAGARRGLEPRAQHPCLCRLLAAPRALVDRAAAGRTCSCRRISRRSRRASGSGAPR